MVPRRINRAVLIKFLVVDFQQLIPNILLVVICIMVPRFSTQDLLAWMPCVGVSPLSPCVSDQNDATFELNYDVLTEQFTQPCFQEIKHKFQSKPIQEDKSGTNIKTELKFEPASLL